MTAFFLIILTIFGRIFKKLDFNPGNSRLLGYHFFLVFYVYYNIDHLILLPVLITAIGDGLAEPVGVRFGRHRYQVRALFSDKKYYRTLEGSACVFLASVAVIALYHALLSLPKLVAAMAGLPAIMNLTKAFSPHIWDRPTLFLVGYPGLFGIMFIC